MNESEKQEFIEHLTSAAEYFKVELPKSISKMYWEMLKKYDIYDVKQAIYNFISNPKKGVFMPKISEIISEIESMEEPEIPAELKAMQAWDEAFSEIKKSGWNYDLVLSDELSNKVIKQMGGIKFLGRTLENEMVWKRKDFETRYVAYLKYPIFIENDEYPRLGSNPMPKTIDFSHTSNPTNQTVYDFAELIKKAP